MDAVDTIKLMVPPVTPTQRKKKQIDKLNVYLDIVEIISIFFIQQFIDHIL